MKLENYRTALASANESASVCTVLESNVPEKGLAEGHDVADNVAAQMRGRIRKTEERE